MEAKEQLISWQPPLVEAKEQLISWPPYVAAKEKCMVLAISFCGNGGIINILATNFCGSKGTINILTTTWERAVGKGWDKQLLLLFSYSFIKRGGGGNSTQGALWGEGGVKGRWGL